MKKFRQKNYKKRLLYIIALVFFVILIFISFRTEASASTYYVATSGNDENSGNSAEPFKTIQKGIDLAKAGDTVVVKDGVYSTSDEYFLWIKNSGTSTNPITIKSENKNGAILDGLGKSGYAFVFMNNSSYVNVENFEIKNFIHDAFHFNDTANPSSNIIINGNEIYNIGRVCTDSQYGSGGTYIHEASAITFKNNIFHDLGRLADGENGCQTSNKYYQNHDHAIYIDGSKDIIIRNNLFYNIKSGWGVHIYSSNDLASSNITIQNNTFAFGNPWRDGSHIVLAGTLSNSKIQNNIFYDQVKAGISVTSDISYSNVSINNNIAYGGDGLIVTSAEKGLILSNNLTNTDPKMINPKVLDFRLTSSSPFKSAGAYEYQSVIAQNDSSSESSSGSGSSSSSSSNNHNSNSSAAGSEIIIDKDAISTEGKSINVAPINTSQSVCAPGHLFSSVTGESCSNTPVSSATTPALLVNSRIMKQGMIGSDVFLLQVYLNSHNFIVSNSGVGSSGNETNYFGEKTQNAVMSFQKANGLTPDGIVGLKTRSFMR